MGSKKFKDPIYGYVEIDEKLIDQVIDTASFQRLRDIIQTSYSPLYVSALHNRFTHSIGVYHLGKITARAFSDSCKQNKIISFLEIKDYLKVFEMACLLHDVGHAPFSHTGENFFYLYYTRKTSKKKLHISELIKDLLHIAYEIENEKHTIELKKKARTKITAAANRLE